MVCSYNPGANLRVRILRVKSSTFQELLFADIVFLLCAVRDVYFNLSETLWQYHLHLTMLHYY